MSDIISLGKLAEALAKAQGAMKPAVKDSINPHFRSNYADLAACWAAIREPLSSNGLAVIQNVSSDQTGVTVETMLVHTSGEHIQSRCWLPVAAKTPQAYGSAITYARRYSLAALVGLSAEDDDGNAASAGGQTVHGFAPAPALPKPAPMPTEEPHVEIEPQNENVRVPFGKNKGVPIARLPIRSLEAYIKMANESLADPSREKFHARTRLWLQDLELELKSRGA